jgi:hypothetical protein
MAPMTERVSVTPTREQARETPSATASTRTASPPIARPPRRDALDPALVDRLAAPTASPRLRTALSAVAAAAGKIRRSPAAQARIAGRDVIRRKPTADQVFEAANCQTNADLAPYPAIKALLVTLTEVGLEYVMSQDQDSPAALPVIARLRQAAAAAEDALTRKREELGQENDTTTGLYLARKAANKLSVEATNHWKTINRQKKGEDYANTIEASTLGALGSGTAKYLMITPRPGTTQAEGSGEAQYPETVPLAQQHTLALPAHDKGASPFKSVNITGNAPPVLDIIAVGGSHGGVERLFEQTNHLAFSKDFWWMNVVKPLVDKGITAHYVVLDACLTASFVDTFSPLLTPNGKVICSMYSVNAKFMSPDMWTKVIAETAKGGATHVEVGKLVESRLQELKAEAPVFATGGLVSGIRAASPQELQEFVHEDPATAPLISKIKYLPKMYDALEPYLADASQSQAALAGLEDVTNADPPPEQEELVLAYEMIGLIMGNDQDGAAAKLRARLQAVTQTAEQDLRRLRDAVTQAVTRDAPTMPATQVPTHLAVFDAATGTLAYDARYDDAVGRTRIEHSTGSESKQEIKDMKRVMGQFAQWTRIKPTPTDVNAMKTT